MPFVAKDEGGAITYTFDYLVNFLDQDSGSPEETLITSVWRVEPDEGSPAGAQVDASSFDSTTATVRVSGGTPGNVYRVINRVTTSFNNTDERTVVFIAGQL